MCCIHTVRYKHRNPHRFVSVQCENLHTILCKPFFSASVSLLASVRTPLLYISFELQCSSNILFQGLIDALEAQVIRKVECGASHSVALTDKGQLFSWGDNVHGQLGCGYTDSTFLRKPRYPHTLYMAGNSTSIYEISN